MEGYERFDESNGSGFVMGLLTGTIVGAALGILFAPKAGSELRTQLSDQANRFADQAQRGYQRAADTASAWADKGRQKGREAYDRTRDAMSRGAQEAERYVRDTSSSTAGTGYGSTGGTS